jgi:hypothetical protein
LGLLQAQSGFSRKGDLLQLGRVLVHSDPHPANSDQLRAVHSQGGYRCSANRSQADNFGGSLAPGKVVGPQLTLRVKQRNDIPGDWIRRRLTVGLITIARGAGQAQIFKMGLPPN